MIASSAAVDTGTRLLRFDELAARSGKAGPEKAGQDKTGQGRIG